jgi:hypothetical protein
MRAAPCESSPDVGSSAKSTCGRAANSTPICPGQILPARGIIYNSYVPLHASASPPQVQIPHRR